MNNLPSEQAQVRRVPRLLADAGMTADGVHIIDRFLKSKGRGSHPTILSSLGVAGLIVCGIGDPYQVPWSQFDGITIQEMAAELRERYMPNTCRKILSFVRGIMVELYRFRIISDETYRRIMSEKIRFGSSLPAGRVIDLDEERELFSAIEADDTPHGIRDFAMISLMRYCGLRRAEVRDLLLSSVDIKRARIVVHGKGSKERIAPMPRGVLPAIQRWLDLRGNEDGPLFYGLSRDHHRPRRNKFGVLKELDLSSINIMLTRRNVLAAIEAATPHDMRRTFGTRRLAQGTDIKVLQQLMGHVSINTTAIYLRLNDEDLHESAQKDAPVWDLQ